MAHSNDNSLEVFMANVLAATPPEGFNLVDEAAGLLEQKETNQDIARWEKGIIGALIMIRAGGDETPMWEAANKAGIDGKTLYEYSLIVRFYGIPYIWEVLMELRSGVGRKIWYTIYRDAYKKFHTNLFNNNGVDLGLEHALDALNQCEGLSVGAARVLMGGGASVTRKTVFQHSARVMGVNLNFGYVTLWVGEAVSRLKVGDEFNLKAWTEQTEVQDGKTQN